MGRRAVYDTMLFFQQAALSIDRTHATFKAVESGDIELCLSHALLLEIKQVLTRPEMLRKAPSLTPERVEKILSALMSRSTLFDPVPQIFHWPEHPDDDHLFNLAIAASADFLVTWETRLLKLPQSILLQLHAVAPHLRCLAPFELLAELRS